MFTRQRGAVHFIGLSVEGMEAERPRVASLRRETLGTRGRLSEMLTRPWLTPVIIAVWAISMNWLVTAKIVPSWSEDAPPGNQILYATDNKLIPVSWTVLWNEIPVGYAISRATRQPDRGLKVESILHFDVMPLDEMLPAWLQAVVQRGINGRITIPFDTRGTVHLDARGSLRSFTSTVTVPGTDTQVALSGMVDQGVASVVVDAQGVQYEGSRRIPDDAVIGDELSPQATMPGLAIGRRWTVPTYSPLRPAGSPIELLHAHVTGEQTFFWQDQLTRVHEVCYRTDPTAPHHDPRFTMLVDMNGRVLKQDSVFLGARLTFVRRSDDDAKQLAARIDDKESATSPPEHDGPGEQDDPGTGR